MHTGTKFNSRFIKAGSRQSESFAGYKALSSQVGEWVSVRDLYVSPGKTASAPAAGNCVNIFLPLLGTARINGSVQRVEVEPEEVFSFGTGGNSSLEITNPHTDQIINLLQVTISDSDPLFYLPPSTSRFNIEKRNQFVSAHGLASGVHAGVFDDGAKGRFSVRNAGSSLLCYVIEGAFEVEGRLMDQRDALFAWDVDQVGFESLSETAIMLLIECSPLN